MNASIFQPGNNCWRVARADRAAVLVDAASYFDALATVIERAERSIDIVGWDLHSRTVLRPEEGLTLRDLIERATSRHPDLVVRILSWNAFPAYVFERELLPIGFWTLGPRVRFRFDSDHALGVSHHQKIVVVDDRVGFVGGIDLTVSRWDERAHDARDVRRRLPGGRTYGPFHDVQLVVDGDAARSLGELVRARWRRATGEAVAPVSVDGDRWPAQVAPAFTSIDVALARTEGPRRGEEGVREVEQLFVDTIAAARRSIYVETQFLTSDVIREALSRRLAEAEGPEILIVTPREQSGPIEDSTMGMLRAHVVSHLRERDRHHRLRVLCPIVPRDVTVNVHAKLMIVDEHFLRIGSANLTNRSLAVDTECDAMIDARGDPLVARAIARVRDGLVAEHLGVSVVTVARAIAAHGSLVRAVDALLGGRRTLTPLEAHRELDDAELRARAEIFDPSHALDEAIVRAALPNEVARQSPSPWPRAMSIAVMTSAVGLSALWALDHVGTRLLSPARLEATFALLREPVAGPVIAVGAFAVCTVAMIPVTPLIAGMVLLFGPVVGGGAALVGGVLGAFGGYGIGRLASSKGWLERSSSRIGRLARALSQRGLPSIVAVRLLPVAPFGVVNVVAGVVRIRALSFATGTLLGLLPGVVAISLSTGRIVAAIREPSLEMVAIAAGVTFGVFAAAAWARRLLKRVGKPT